MKEKINLKFWLLPVLALLLSGCVTQQPYDYTAINNSKPRSIVILPPINNSVEINATYAYLSTLTRPLAERGYYVFPVSLIDNLMKSNGLPTPVEMHSAPLNKINEIIGADAVLYVIIEEWGQSYRLTSSVSVVNVNMKLVDVKSGELLWEGSGSAEQGSGDGGGGLFGAIVGAIVTQIMSEAIDNTPTLSRRVNDQMFHNVVNGLPPGPYKPNEVSAAQTKSM
ncbi:MAG: DUF799 domain-containing protein [Gammaproteobacteria bacterium]|nr:DUF799 domain-containing protein [Gammaproteobacteria bacterium]